MDGSFQGQSETKPKQILLDDTLCRVAGQGNHLERP
jgi:hypothetical protein